MGKTRKDTFVYRRTGKRWNKLRVLDWNKSTVFVAATDGSIIELDRIKLHTDRVASDESGVRYYAPDAKKAEAAKAKAKADAAKAAKWERQRKAEEAERAAEDAAAEAYMAAHVKRPGDWYVYSYTIIEFDRTSRNHVWGWQAYKVRNWTKDRVFVIDGEWIARLDRDELRKHGVAVESGGETYYTEAGKARTEAEWAAAEIRAKERAEAERAARIRAEAEAVERQRRREEERARERLFADGLRSRIWAEIFAREQKEREADAILGVSPEASRSEIIAAYKQRAKLHHPDAGGNAAMFILLGEAKDRTAPSLRLACASVPLELTRRPAWLTSN